MRPVYPLAGQQRLPEQSTATSRTASVFTRQLTDDGILLLGSQWPGLGTYTLNGSTFSVVSTNVYFGGRLLQMQSYTSGNPWFAR
jgi:hypothetical protein